MNHPIIRSPELELTLVAQIRKEGSQCLFNALEDCQIRVETYNGWAYAVMTFASRYDWQARQELCNEVERIGIPLEIFGCDDSEPVIQPTITIIVDPDARRWISEKLKAITGKLNAVDEGGEP